MSIATLTNRSIAEQLRKHFFKIDNAARPASERDARVGRPDLAAVVQDATQPLALRMACKAALASDTFEMLAKASRVGGAGRISTDDLEAIITRQVPGLAPVNAAGKALVSQIVKENFDVLDDYLHQDGSKDGKIGQGDLQATPQSPLSYEARLAAGAALDLFPALIVAGENPPDENVFITRENLDAVIVDWDK